MNKSSIGVSAVALASLGIFISPSFSADVPISGYSYSVTDVQSKGLKAETLYDSLSTSWMDLEHSTCSNRAYLWSRELNQKYKINTGTVFIFFGAKVWEHQKKGYWYHAAPYIVENGKELVMEKSYPDEITKPVSIVEWMDNEMEGRVDASKCVEVKKDVDRDITELFYYHQTLPNQRVGGKPAYDCYYRKIPSYVAYPEVTAELELGVQEDGKPTDYKLKGYDSDILYQACLDVYHGRHASAAGFCDVYLK